MDDNSTSLSNHFLIAMPNLADPNFFHTVTLICEHNDEGALGIVINRPTDFSLGELLQQLGLIEDADRYAEIPVYSGGPVQEEHGFIVHSPRGNWQHSLPFGEDLALTTSRDLLQGIVEGRGPEHMLVALGYAGWGPGQLEQELAENAWLTTPASHEILFELPAEARWKAAAAQLGIDLDLLSGDAGHA
ncbi:MAG: YqgE/AlgH family protein [Gammaproteobacteria bacterium]|nr:MAG: YqgE/AlgH family protein [Gammaproteobacteria bacterium]